MDCKDDKKIAVTSGSPLLPRRTQRKMLSFGMRLSDMLTEMEIPERLWPNLRVLINSTVVPIEWLDRVSPKAGTNVTVILVPTGGGLIDNGTLRVLGGIMSLALGAGVSMAAGLDFGSVEYMVVATLITFAGMWAVTTFIKPPDQDLEDRSYAITSSRNALRPYDPVPKIFGRTRIFPMLAAHVKTRIEADEQHAQILYLLGYKPLRIVPGTIKLGEALLSSYRDKSFSANTGWRYNQLLMTEYGGITDEAIIDAVLLYAKSWQKNAPAENKAILEADHPNVFKYVTQSEIDEISIDFSFPRGLGRYNGETLNGNRVDVALEYRTYGSTGNMWTPVIPTWFGAEYYAAAVTFTDSEFWANLEKFNEDLEATIEKLKVFSVAQRIIHDVLLRAMEKRLAGAYGWIGEAITDGDLSPTEEAELFRYDSNIREVEDLMNQAEVVTANTIDGLETFNAVLSAAMFVVEVVDSMIEFNKYVAQGYGPDIDLFARPIQRWIINKRGIAHLFGAPETGAFFFAPDEVRTGVFRKNVRWPVGRGQYEIRIRRITPDEGQQRPNDKGDSNVLDELRVFIVRTIRNEEPIRREISSKVALAGLDIKATDEVSGSVDQFNCIVEAPIPYYDTVNEVWTAPKLNDGTDYEVFRNPAWVFCEILRGVGNKQPVADSRIDIDRMVEFAEWCKDNNFYFDGIFDKKTTVQKALEAVCAVAKASPIIRDGKWSVVIDKPESVPVQVFSIRNVADFSAQRLFAPIADAIRVKYVNVDGYGQDEMYVYNDGYGDPNIPNVTNLRLTMDGDTPSIIPLTVLVEGEQLEILEVLAVYDTVTNTEIDNTVWRMEVNRDSGLWMLRRRDAGPWGDGEYRYRVTVKIDPKEPVNIEKIDLFGVVDSPYPFSAGHTGQAYKLGRYLMKSVEHRPEIFSFNVPWEHLICERGDMVHLQFDTILSGLGAGRVVSVVYNGSDELVSLTLDSMLIVPKDAPDWAMRIRINTGEQFEGELDLTIYPESGDYPNVTFLTPLDTGGQTVQPGDLVTWGEVGQVTTPCKVHEVRPKDDLGAQLYLVALSNVIHNAADEVIPDYDPKLTIPRESELHKPQPPIIREVITDERAMQVMPGGSLAPKIKLYMSVQERSGQVSHQIAGIEAQYRRLQRVFDERGKPILPVGAQGRQRVSFSPEASRMPRSRPEGEWQRAGLVTNNLSEMILDAVVRELTYYDVRVRAVSRGGVYSDWAMASNIFVTGKTNPPPDVTNVEWVGDELRWLYTEPIDHGGYYIRHLAGETGNWDMATPAHDGIFRETRLNTAVIGSGGIRQYFIKAVDSSGNMSVKAARVVKDLGSPSTGSAIEFFSAAPFATQPGTVLQNMTIAGTSPYQAEGDIGGWTTFFRSSNPNEPLFLDDPDAAFFGDGYKEAILQFSQKMDQGGTSPDDTFPKNISLLANITTGKGYVFEMKSDAGYFWPEYDVGAEQFNSPDEKVWQGNLSGAMWPDWEWRAVINKVPAEFGATYSYRCRQLAGSDTQLRIDGSVVAGVSGFGILTDAPPLSEEVQDFFVNSSGTVRLAIVNKYRKITAVTLSLQIDATYPNGYTVKVKDKDATNGPAIEVYDIAGARVAGIVDAKIQGY
jgi:hypothetical protein